MAETEESMLEEITTIIVHEMNPEKIVLFGSRARGTAKPESDVDLLIVEKPDAPSKLSRRQKMARLWKVLAPFPVSQDILIYSSAEIEKWESSKNHIISRALREGKILYER
ncbi:MAG: Nucleotidyltransferase domain protein [Syntrophus sp. PtaB.Bin138]|nr:MAG: Nucleotidyltransferase domain protein [Syntrophus sp. PtaB.Bin138]